MSLDPSASQKFYLSSESRCIQIYSCVWFQFVGLATNLVGAAACRLLGGILDDALVIKAAVASCDGGGTVILDQVSTIANVLQTTDLNNVGIQLSGTI